MYSVAVKVPQNRPPLRIGELGQRPGMSDHVLRAWGNSCGLPQPARSPGGFRLYSEADEWRLRRMQAYLADGPSRQTFTAPAPWAPRWPTARRPTTSCTRSATRTSNARTPPPPRHSARRARGPGCGESMGAAQELAPPLPPGDFHPNRSPMRNGLRDAPPYPRCRARQHHGQAATLAPRAPGRCHSLTGRDDAAHCPGHRPGPMGARRIYRSALQGREDPKILPEGNDAAVAMYSKQS